MEFKLKPLTLEGVPRALTKAERYRLLNEPREAESICLAALEVEPNNQDAIRMLLLALTDQFTKKTPVAFVNALKTIGRLCDEYDRAYYTGIIYERQAKVQLDDAHAFEWLREAMGWYEKAEAIRPLGNDDAVLRWNTCATMIMRDLG